MFSAMLASRNSIRASAEKLCGKRPHSLISVSSSSSSGSGLSSGYGSGLSAQGLVTTLGLTPGHCGLGLLSTTDEESPLEIASFQEPSLDSTLGTGNILRFLSIYGTIRGDSSYGITRGDWLDSDMFFDDCQNS